MLLNWNSIKHFQLIKVKDHIRPIIQILRQRIPTYTQNNQLTQPLYILDLLDILNTIIP